MRTLTRGLYILAITALFVGCSPVESNEQASETETPATMAAMADEDITYEIAFCLDATGSMSGLIQTAKDKIWDIVSALAQDQKIDTLRLGMVFYRDIGDAFVTLPLDLTTDIDTIYGELLKMSAQGGGDSPESVNEALGKAVNDFSWSSSPETQRTIFIVGDCPPHMDYQAPNYDEHCKAANQKGIVVNTIKLGNQCQDAIPHFREIAHLTNGVFMQLDQNATDYTVPTPYDDSVVYYSRAIDQSKVYYGSKASRDAMYMKKDKSISMYDESSTEANASRSKYNATKSGKMNRYKQKELINDIEDGTVKLSDIKEDELPKELKDMPADERQNYIDSINRERKVNEKLLDTYVKKQVEYINDAKSSDTTKRSFSDEIIETLKKQKEIK